MRLTDGVWKDRIIPVVVAIIAFVGGLLTEMYKGHEGYEASLKEMQSQMDRQKAGDNAALERLQIELNEKRKEESAKETESTCLRQAAYLDEMATSLQLMIDKFRKDETPHEEGATFNEELAAFGDSSREAFGRERWTEQIESLKQVSYEAKYDIDPATGTKHIPYYEEERIEKWIGNASEAKGKLKARAAELRSGFSSCDVAPSR